MRTARGTRKTNNPRCEVLRAAPPQLHPGKWPRGGWTQSAPQRLPVPREGMPFNSGQQDDCSFAASTPATVSTLKRLRLSRARSFESHSLRQILLILLNFSGQSAFDPRINHRSQPCSSDAWHGRNGAGQARGPAGSSSSAGGVRWRAAPFGAGRPRRRGYRRNRNRIVGHNSGQ
jgi:hypothetical protein